MADPQFLAQGGLAVALALAITACARLWKALQERDARLLGLIEDSTALATKVADAMAAQAAALDRLRQEVHDERH